jgi:hypothetical protein
VREPDVRPDDDADTPDPADARLTDADARPVEYVAPEPVTVTLTVTPTTARVGEVVRVEAVATGTGSPLDIALPDAFSITNRMTSTLYQSNAGRVSRKVQLILEVRPDAPGSHRIGPARVESDLASPALSETVDILVQP